MIHRTVAAIEQAISRLLIRRWYDFDRRPPRPLVMVWGRLLRWRGR